MTRIAIQEEDGFSTATKTNLVAALRKSEWREGYDPDAGLVTFTEPDDEDRDLTAVCETLGDDLDPTGNNADRDENGIYCVFSPLPTAGDNVWAFSLTYDPDPEPETDPLFYSVQDPTTGMPAITTLLHRVCDQDPGKFHEVNRVIQLFIDAARETRT